MGTRNSFVFLVSGVFAASVCCYADTAPCDLLTQDQVSTAIGAPVSAGAPIANTGCSWRATGKSKTVVTVSMQNEKMFGGAKSGPVPPNMTRSAVSAVGDEAIFIGAEGFSSLWVRKGSKYLLVRLYGLPVSEAQTKLKTLATSAVSKL